MEKPDKLTNEIRTGYNNRGYLVQQLEVPLDKSEAQDRRAQQRPHDKRPKGARLLLHRYAFEPLRL
jgi:hypothetical protein